MQLQGKGHDSESYKKLSKMMAHDRRALVLYAVLLFFFLINWKEVVVTMNDCISIYWIKYIQSYMFCVLYSLLALYFSVSSYLKDPIFLQYIDVISCKFIFHLCPVSNSYKLTSVQVKTVPNILDTFLKQLNYSFSWTKSLYNHGPLYMYYIPDIINFIRLLSSFN